MWDFPLFPEQASTIAPRVDALYFSLVAVAGGTGVLVAILVIVFAVRYRAGSAVSRRPLRIRSWKLETAWIVVPLLLFMGIFVWAGWLYANIQYPPADALDIYVIGKQWMWQAQHLGGQREINQLHVRVGQPVRLTLASQDVIHSYYIPAFRVKQDAVPGRYTSLWFTPTKTGRFHLFCAEYCGTQHSGMVGTIIVQNASEHAAWLQRSADAGGTGGETAWNAGAAGMSSAATGGALASPGSPMASRGLSPMAAAGERHFQRLGCTNCHESGSAQRAPFLTGLYGSQVSLADGSTVRADEQYLRQSILQPNARIVAGYPSPSLMPSFQGRLGEEQLAELLEYLKSQSTRSGAAEERR